MCEKDKKNGALTGTRTQDPVIKSHLLYQLSYERITSYNMLRDPAFFKCENEKKAFFSLLVR